MNIPTKQTQDKLAHLLHDTIVRCEHTPETGGEGLDNCWHQQLYVQRAALLLGLLLPVMSKEIFPAIRDDLRERIGEKIMSEMVCCDIYEQLERVGHDLPLPVLSRTTPGDLADKHGLNFHDLCYFGAWAATYALSECPSGHKKCQPSYYCPTNARYESPCHGGFDVCCDHPDLHQLIVTPEPEEVK